MRTLLGAIILLIPLGGLLFGVVMSLAVVLSHY